MYVSHKISVLITKQIFFCISLNLLKFLIRTISNPGPSQCMSFLEIFSLFQFARYGDNKDFKFSGIFFGPGVWFMLTFHWGPITGLSINLYLEWLEKDIERRFLQLQDSQCLAKIGPENTMILAIKSRFYQLWNPVCDCLRTGACTDQLMPHNFLTDLV